MNEAMRDSAETQQLLERIRAGDRPAFEQLFARHRPYLRHVVELRLDPRLRPRLDPSDVVQDTQLAAFQRLDDYLRRQPMPFRLWLRQTARERLIMLRRHHLTAARRAAGREGALPERSSLLLAQQLLAREASPSQQWDRREAARLVRDAVAGLADIDREILLMRNFEGLSNREVACVLGLEPGTASRRYGRALLRLREVLKGHDPGAMP